MMLVRQSVGDRLVTSGLVDLDPLVTARYPLAWVETAVTATVEPQDMQT